MPVFHQSRLYTMLACGQAYMHRYVYGRVYPPSIRMAEGTAVHKAAELDLQSKIASGDLLPEDDVLDAARDTLVKNWEEGVTLLPDERGTSIAKLRGEATDTAVRMAQAGHRILAPTIQPEFVERRFEIEHPDLPFTIRGTIDVQERTDGKLRLRDFKTAKKTPAADRAEKSTQLTIYSMGVAANDGAYPDEVCIDTIVDLKRETKVVSQSSVRDMHDFNQAIRRMQLAYDAIEKGVFLPCNEDSWMCSEKFCPHWENDCEFGRRGRKRMTT